MCRDKWRRSLTAEEVFYCDVKIHPSKWSNYYEKKKPWMQYQMQCLKFHRLSYFPSNPAMTGYISKTHSICDMPFLLSLDGENRWWGILYSDRCEMSFPHLTHHMFSIFHFDFKKKDSHSTASIMFSRHSRVILCNWSWVNTFVSFHNLCVQCCIVLIYL